jgi:indole-3-glycerol phosphate synthase
VGFLTDLVGAIRRDLARSPLDESRLLARALALPPARDLARAIMAADPRPGLIAEVKRASPSSGPIDPAADPGVLAAAYENAGALAVSVLTEPRHFEGSLADLALARRRTTLPVLRKDFLILPSQVIESRAAGADAVLLIASALPGPELGAMLETAKDLGLSALVEAHDDPGLEHALASGAELVGVNARDLETLEVDAGRALARAARVPPGRLLVVESGIASRADVERAGAAGARAVLVGEVLVRSGDPGATVRELLGG